MKWYEHVDWKFFGFTIGILAAPLVVYALPIDPRLTGSVLGGIAACVLTLRLIGWFSVTPTGMRMLAFLLIITLILGAVGQLLAHNDHVPLTPVTYILISQRLMCIGAAIYWTKWTDTKVSPFVRHKAYARG